MDTPIRSRIVEKLPPILLLACLCTGPSASVSAADLSPAHKSPRTVHFTVRDQERSSLSSGELRLPLTIELSRESSDPEYMLVILEGTLANHLWVPMIPASASKTWQTTVMLEPAPNPQTEKTPQRYRIDVSFARVQGMKLTRFLTRSVYVTTGILEETCSLHHLENRGLTATVGGLFAPEEAQAASPAVREEAVDETHLAGTHTPEGGAAYWWGVKQRIAQRWKQHKRERPVFGKTAPHVHFRLYANGIAQAVYLEQSSGHRRVDDAALASVVDSQPFPPFPSGLGRCYLDVRVDLQASKRR